MGHRAVMNCPITIKEKPLGSLLVRVKPSGQLLKIFECERAVYVGIAGSLEIEEIFSCVELDRLRSERVWRQWHTRWIIGSALQHIALFINHRPSATKIVTHIISVRQNPRSGIQIGVLIICSANGSHGY